MSVLAAIISRLSPWWYFHIFFKFYVKYFKVPWVNEVLLHRHSLNNHFLYFGIITVYMLQIIIYKKPTKYTLYVLCWYCLLIITFNKMSYSLRPSERSCLATIYLKWKYQNFTCWTLIAWLMNSTLWLVNNYLQ